PSGACLHDTRVMPERNPTDAEALHDGFAAIEALAAVCRCRDCRHQAEPGCAVRAAGEAGDLDPGRLANYHKLQAEVARAADRLASRLGHGPGGTRGPGRGPARR